jgi:hypothetical protein
VSQPEQNREERRGMHAFLLFPVRRPLFTSKKKEDKNQIPILCQHISFSFVPLSRE